MPAPVKNLQMTIKYTSPGNAEPPHGHRRRSASRF